MRRPRAPSTASSPSRPRAPEQRPRPARRPVSDRRRRRRVRGRGEPQNRDLGSRRRGPGPAQPLLLCRGARRREHELAPDDVRRLLAAPDTDGLAEVLPTFAAVDHVGEATLVAAADVLGFRHLYHGAGRGLRGALDLQPRRRRLPGRGARSRGDRGAEPAGLAARSAHPVRGVHKLGRASSRPCGDGTLSTRPFRRPLDAGRGLDAAVEEAAGVLRAYMTALPRRSPRRGPPADRRSGLAAPAERRPPQRRRGLRTVTLGAPRQPGRGDRGGAVAALRAGPRGADARTASRS